MSIEIFNEGNRRLEMLSQASKSKMQALFNEPGMDPSVRKTKLEKGFASVLAVETMKDLVSKVGENLGQLDMEILLGKDSLQKTAKDIFDSEAFHTITDKLSAEDFLGIAADNSNIAAEKAYQTFHDVVKSMPAKRADAPAPAPTPRQVSK